MPTIKVVILKCETEFNLKLVSRFWSSHLHIKDMHYVCLFFKWWQQALFPSKCLVCLTEGEVLCEDHKIKSSLIVIPLKPDNLLDKAFAVSAYEKANVKKIIGSFKFSRHKAALVPMTEALVENLNAEDLAGYTLIPLPLHWRREHWRGFNQATLITKRLASRLGLKTECKSLIRVKNTQQQARLTATERAINLKEACVWNSDLKAPERVILVDDVFTTGSTLDSAARTLKDNGAHHVVAVVFAYQSLTRKEG